MSTMDDFLAAQLKKEESTLDCRLCLQSLQANARLYSLFEAWDPPWEGMEATIADDLNRLANIQIAAKDNQSKIICESCYDRLQDAASFVKLVQKNNQCLKHSVQIEIDVSSEQIWPQPIQLDKNVSASVYSNQMEVEVKQEVLSEDETVPPAEQLKTERQQALCDANMDIKVEPEEITPQNPITNHSNAGKSRPKRCRRNRDSSDFYFTDEEYLDDIKQEVPSEEEKESAPQLDLPLDCMLCSRRFNSIFGLKAHVIVNHSYKTVRRRGAGATGKRPRLDKHVCTTCRRTFSTPTDLMVHETCHSSVACYVCQMKFDTFDQLARHRRRCTKTKVQSKQTKKLKTLDDVKRVHPQAVIVQSSKPQIITCPSCPEQFSDPYYLSIHEEIHHSTTNNELNFVPTGSQRSEVKVTMSNEESGTKDEVVNDFSCSVQVEHVNETAESVDKVLEQVRDSLETDEEKLVTSSNGEKLEGENESKSVDNGLDCLKESLEEKIMEESTSTGFVANEQESTGLNTVLEQVNPLAVEFEKGDENTFSNELNNAEDSSEIVNNVMERLRASLATKDEASIKPDLNENESSGNINTVLDHIDGTQVEKYDAAPSSKELVKENELPEIAELILKKESTSSRTKGEQLKVASSDNRIAKEIDPMESLGSNMEFVTDSIDMEHEKSETEAGNEVIHEESAVSDLGREEDSFVSGIEHLESVVGTTEINIGCNGKDVDNNELDTVSEKVSEDIALEADLESIPIVKQFLDAIPENEDGDNKVQDMEIDSIETEAKILDSKISVADFSHSSSENVKEPVDSNKYLENDNIHV